MRLVHTTDIHWYAPPPLLSIPGKRILGSANLFLRGRKHHFDLQVQRALVSAMVDAQPDAVVITGDLTAQALPAEFEIAKAELSPILSRFPTLIQTGNHDVYTRGSARDRRIQQWFGDWMFEGPHGLAQLDVPGVTVVGVDASRPHVAASGKVPDVQLAALPGQLEAVPADHAIVLALHYPVLGRDGQPYDGWEHGLRNARDLIEVLRASRRRPDLIIHGHIHHGFQTSLDLGDVQVPIVNPGSGGYAHLPQVDRAGCFNIYTFDDAKLVDVERFRFDGTMFVPEAGGAYASGR